MDNIFRAFEPDARVDKRHRNLPHWEQPGCTYFIGFRLADSLSQSQLCFVAEDRQQWLDQHPKPWTTREYEVYQNRFTERIETWLDNGYGSCVLEKPEVGKKVAESLLHFDGKRYILDRYVVMPNHVHALVKPHEDHPLKKILQSWRSYTGVEINKHLNQSGQLWMDEPFDHVVRSWKHLCYYRSYIEDNPSKAGLDPDQYVLGTGVGLVLE